MKTFIFLFVCMVSLRSVSQNVPEPEFPLRVYYLTPLETLKDLDRVPCELKTKASGLGGRIELYYPVEGDRSPLRFNAGNVPKLYLKVTDGRDPSDFVALVVGSIKGGERRFTVESHKRKLMGYEKQAGDLVKVLCEFKKVREQLYEVTIKGSLASGEYAFMPMQAPLVSGITVSSKIMCFGID